MEALVIYDSEFGNTEKVARAIMKSLSEHYAVRAVPVSEATSTNLEAPDLLLFGGPTQKHGMSPKLSALLSGIPQKSLSGLRAAAFDTRYRMARLLSGSAAWQAAGHLKKAGCKLVAEPESFFVERDVPPKGEKRRHALERLEPGEIERAGEWARRLVAGDARR